MRTTPKKKPDAATPEASDPVDAAALAELTWATPAVDVAPPIGLDELLQCLQFLATDEARAKGATFTGGTPPSLQAIKSGALSSTKWASGLVAGIGGLTGAAAAAAGAIGTFSDTAGTAETVALIGGAAVLLGAVAMALSIFVGTDLMARGLATAARHEGRAKVASAFLTATGGMPGSTGSSRRHPPGTHARRSLPPRTRFWSRPTL